MHIPLNFNLKDRSVLLIGGGNVALEKLNFLAQAGSRLTIVAQYISAEFKNFLANNSFVRYELFEREFTNDDLMDQTFVFIAIDDSALAQSIAQMARSKGSFVNVADQPTLCDFYTTALINRGDFQIALASNGKYAGLSAALRKHFEWCFPQDMDGDWEKLFELRSALIRSNIDPQMRRKKLKSIIREIEKELLGEQSEIHLVLPVENTVGVP